MTRSLLRLLISTRTTVVCLSRLRLHWITASLTFCRRPRCCHQLAPLLLRPRQPPQKLLRDPVKLTSPSCAALKHYIHLTDELPLHRCPGSPWEPIPLAVPSLAKVINRTALLSWSFSPTSDPLPVRHHAGKPPPWLSSIAAASVHRCSTPSGQPRPTHHP
jgi:hypothetical protein